MVTQTEPQLDDLAIYRVGGAVRDQLLGYPSHETDWVVVGATPDDLLSRGFTPVGKDFPVFLHPESHEEYALARTERKAGHGYHGFAVHADPSVTLEEDLQRRDLTVNAMAMSVDGQLIDPYGGQQDLERRLLRHVSPAFIEDPLRVLRVARFAARYHHLGFSVADETQALMTDIVAQGELEHLSIERVWIETERALGERDPAVYFRVLSVCDACEQLIPGINEEQLASLTQAAAVTDSSLHRWAALLSTLSVDRVDAIGLKLKTPNAYSALAGSIAAWCTSTRQRDAKQVLDTLIGLKALKQGSMLDDFLAVIAALDGKHPRDHATCQLFSKARDVAAQVSATQFASEGIEGPALGAAIKAERINRIQTVIDRAG